MKKRPDRRDPAIVRQASDKLAPSIAAWMTEYETTVDEVSADLAHVARWGDTDGYKLAADLERQKYYSPDAELVEILDSFAHCLSEAHRLAVRQWVIEEGVVPFLNVGDLVTTKYGQGTIVEVKAEEAYYLVKVENDRHGASGYIGTHCNYETVQLASSEVA